MPDTLSEFIATTLLQCTMSIIKLYNAKPQFCTCTSRLKNIFRSCQKLSKKCIRSQRLWDNKFQTVGSATEKTQQPNAECQRCGTQSWWQCCRSACSIPSCTISTLVAKCKQEEKSSFCPLVPHENLRLMHSSCITLQQFHLSTDFTAAVSKVPLSALTLLVR